jgi:hypothetical protein
MPKTKKDLTVPVTITMPKSLKQRARTVARLEGISMSSWIVKLLRGHFSPLNSEHQG